MGPGTGIDVTFVIDGSFIGSIDGNTNRFWGFISDSPFKEVKLSEDDQAIIGDVEMYDLDDLTLSKHEPMIQKTASGKDAG